MAARSDVAKPSEDLDFVLARTFDAPRDLVWKAWTDPRHLAKWWGPRFFGARCELDLRAGGAYRFVMIGPDGGEYPMKGKYVEVKAPERLAYTVDHSESPDAWHDMVDPGRDRTKGRQSLETVTTVTFEARGDKTLVTVKTRFATKALREGFLRVGMREGWTSSLEKLDEMLFADREITASRTFDAPRDLVFDAWTKPEHLPKWWGPKGFTNAVRAIDIRPGGKWSFVMRGPDGTEYPNEIVFVELARPERVVLDHVSGPLFRMTATFSEWMGKTTVAVRMRFATAALRDEVAKKFGAVEGLVQNLEKLGDYLSARASAGP